MVTEELINYIRLQKQQGKSEAEISNALLSNKWSKEDINEAFLSIDKQPTFSQTPQESQGLKPVQAQPAGNIAISKSNVSEEKPKVIRTVSILLFLIAVLYVFTAVSMTGIMVIMDKAVGGGNLVFSFLRYFPSFGPIPVLFSLAALLFFYVALKTQDGSKFSFWTATTSILIVPFPLGFFVSQFLLTPFTRLASSVGAVQTESVPSIPIDPRNLRFNDPIFIFSILTAVLLIFGYRKFSFDSEKLTKKARMFLVLATVILVIPIISIVSMGYIRAQDRDYGYKKAQSSVNYHIYKSTLPEKELTNATKFITNKDLAGKQDAIQVAYDLPFDQLMKTGKTKPIILKQVQVEPDFDLRAFVSQEISEPESIDKVNLSTAKGQSAVLVRKKLEKLEVYYLSYITPDNVLIFIASPKVSPNELKKFADSLQ